MRRGQLSGVGQSRQLHPVPRRLCMLFVGPQRLREPRLRPRHLRCGFGCGELHPVRCWHLCGLGRGDGLCRMRSGCIPLRVRRVVLLGVLRGLVLRRSRHHRPPPVPRWYFLRSRGFCRLAVRARDILRGRGRLGLHAVRGRAQPAGHRRHRLRALRRQSSGLSQWGRCLLSLPARLLLRERDEHHPLPCGVLLPRKFNLGVGVRGGVVLRGGRFQLQPVRCGQVPGQLGRSFVLELRRGALLGAGRGRLHELRRGRLPERHGRERVLSVPERLRVQPDWRSSVRGVCVRGGVVFGCWRDGLLGLRSGQILRPRRGKLRRVRCGQVSIWHGCDRVR